MKRKIKIAKNVAKVPERRTKMRRKKREKKKFGQVVLQTGNFHFRMVRVCGACGCPILGAVLGR
ncbi:hypothetical protein M5E86_04095 [Blautia wexlerae]|nr:hypothetical protein M5E86_04095 [Blautia wexlerae]